MMNDAAVETAYLAWIADQQIPADVLLAVIREYRTGEAVFHAVTEGDPHLDEMIRTDVISRMRASGTRENLRRLYDLTVQHRILSVTAVDDSFPAVLSEIPDPVSILFYRGDLSCLQKRKIAMVGSRHASYAGLKAAETIARELSSSGIAVISGFANGIDTACHEGCLKGGAPTIAVLGCGLDQSYPAANSGLRKRLLENGGLLISEFSPGQPPLSYHFPYRNRIISGLGDAVILMEARIRSGSLVTVSHALNQGKEVFVYPGDPSSPYSEGNRQLLREGATYFTTARDILADMNWLDNPPDEVHNSDCSVLSKARTETETAVLNCLLPGPRSFDQLSDACGLPPAELLSVLTMLQIRGMVESVPGKKYQIIQ